MTVVEVRALRDYEGCQWTRLFTTEEKAWEFVRTAAADEWLGVDDVNVTWVGVDEEFYDRVESFVVTYDLENDSATFQRWDLETKAHVPFEV
jgi:hypothetical protein